MDEGNCGSSVTMFVKFNAEIDFFFGTRKEGHFFQVVVPENRNPCCSTAFSLTSFANSATDIL
jgi:hypothetical protein